MMKMFLELLNNENGQGVAEYALILTGITLLVMVLIYTIGNRLVLFYNAVINN